LLGTYELELHSVIEEAIAKRFERIIDIGCADGYYAVGLAMRTNATVYAFDCEPREREYCRQMALTNGVHQRVHVRSWCSGRELKSLATGRCLEQNHGCASPPSATQVHEKEDGRARMIHTLRSSGYVLHAVE